MMQNSLKDSQDQEKFMSGMKNFPVHMVTF